jgi:hypothetical protein
MMPFVKAPKMLLRTPPPGTEMCSHQHARPAGLVKQGSESILHKVQQSDPPGDGYTSSSGWSPAANMLNNGSGSVIGGMLEGAECCSCHLFAAKGELRLTDIWSDDRSCCQKKESLVVSRAHENGGAL